MKNIKGNVAIGLLSVIATSIGIIYFVINPINREISQVSTETKENTNNISAIASDLAYIKGGLDMLLNKNNISPEQVKKKINQVATSSSENVK